MSGRVRRSHHCRHRRNSNTYGMYEFVVVDPIWPVVRSIVDICCVLASNSCVTCLLNNNNRFKMCRTEIG